MEDKNFVKLPIQVFLKKIDSSNRVMFLKVPLPIYVRHSRKVKVKTKIASLNRMKSMYITHCGDVTVDDYEQVLSILNDGAKALLSNEEVNDEQDSIGVSSSGNAHVYEDKRTHIYDEHLEGDCNEINEQMSKKNESKETDNEFYSIFKQEPFKDYSGESSNGEAHDDDNISMQIDEEHFDGGCEEFNERRLKKIESVETNDEDNYEEFSDSIISVEIDEISSVVTEKLDETELPELEFVKEGCQYKCMACNSSFKSAAGIRRHKTYMCSALPNDIVRQNKERSMCTECGRVFMYRHVLANHKAVAHRRIKPHKCVYCDKKYYTRTSLNSHCRSVHVDMSHHVCDICTKTFKTHEGVKHHKRNVHMPAVHVCTVCKNKLKTLSNLRAHMRKHTKSEKMHKCDICPKAFSVPGRLRRHMGTHGGEKMNMCQECGKTFLAAYNLHVHMRIHSGEKPYVCEVCGRCFSQSVGLKVHICKPKQLNRKVNKTIHVDASQLSQGLNASNLRPVTKTTNATIADQFKLS